MTEPQSPFQFATATYLTRILNQQARNLAELLQGLEECSDGSVFHHTFQSLGRHHFLTEGFSNDFAQWALASCNQPGLAERLASLDIRDYPSLKDLRADLLRVMGEYAQLHPAESRLSAFEPFYFCESVEVTVPLSFQAESLAEFRDGVARLSHSALNYHFIASRLRLHLGTNDFSNWLAKDLGLDSLARRVNRIDIYTNTIQSMQKKLIALIDQEMAS
ncbi:MAG: hypothetical protein DMG21_18420 [Acidobacteria bacterium]|nr:MAG: hypothetical protein DMG21_18420 [Acidobacteriota bacterium]